MQFPPFSVDAAAPIEKGRLVLGCYHSSLCFWVIASHFFKFVRYAQKAGVAWGRFCLLVMQKSHWWIRTNGFEKHP